MFPSALTLQSAPLDRLNILGMELSSDLNHRAYIEAVTKLGSKKLGVLNKVRWFFTPQQRLLLYKAQIRPCVEYCSHLWDRSAKYLLDALDSLQRRAVRIIGDEEVTRHLEPLQLRRDVASLSVFYRLYHGECSEELFNLIPTSRFRSRTTRAGLAMHPHVVEPLSTRTRRQTKSFICRTICLWNDLPACVFPSSYNMGSFKRGVKKHLMGQYSGGD